MTTRTRTDGAPDLFKVVRTAAWLNFEGAARTVIRGRRGWVGAVNTDYDPLDPRTAAQPHAAYQRLHQTGRVHYNPRRAMWVLARLDDVRATLRATDKVTSSQGVTRLRIQAPLVVLTDGEEHTRLRKQIQPMFTTGAMASWRAMADKLAAEMVDDLICAPGSDVMAKLATPLPMGLIAHIMGVPDGDFGDFRRWSETTVRIMDANATPQGIRHARDAATGLASMRRYFLGQFAAGKLQESDSALGRLMKHNKSGELSGHDLFMIAMLLLVAGNETTTNLLGGMFETFARNPEQYDRVRENPDLIPMAIEEHMRFSSPIQNLYRYTARRLRCCWCQNSQRVKGASLLRCRESRPRCVRGSQHLPRRPQPQDARRVRSRRTPVCRSTLGTDGSPRRPHRTHRPRIADRAVW
jgi:cytochrome P450